MFARNPHSATRNPQFLRTRQLVALLGISERRLQLWDENYSPVSKTLKASGGRGGRPARAWGEVEVLKVLAALDLLRRGYSQRDLTALGAWDPADHNWMLVRKHGQPGQPFIECFPDIAQMLKQLRGAGWAMVVPVGDLRQRAHELVVRHGEWGEAV